jgi:hypothetical protein
MERIIDANGMGVALAFSKGETGMAKRMKPLRLHRS